MTGLEDDVASIIVDVTDQGEDFDLGEGEIAVVSAEQVLQDERLLELEMDSNGMFFYAERLAQLIWPLVHFKFVITINFLFVDLLESVTVLETASHSGRQGDDCK